MTEDVLQLAGWHLAALLAVALLLGVFSGIGAAVLWRRRALAAPTGSEESEPDSSDEHSARVLSHEIRTPLTLVKGAAELLAEETPGPLNPTQRYFVDTIVDNTSLVISMAEDLLLEARLENGAPTLDRAAVEIRALVRQTVLELRRIRSTTLQLDSQGGPLVLDVDRAMIRQVLWNLINNAVRHAGADAEVTVRVEATAEGATISVTDDGGGMEPEQRAELFSSQASGHPQGTGLGMGVIRQVVAAHGGRIVVDSLVRRGTRILVVLPWPEQEGSHV